MKIIAQEGTKTKKKSQKTEGGRKMKRLAAFAVLAVMLLACTSQALAYWKPAEGTFLSDPEPTFAQSTLK